MKKYVTILISVCLLSACGGRQTETDENGKPLVIDLQTAISSPVKEMLLSDVAEDIEIIPLETKEETMFHRDLHIISFRHGILLCPGGGEKTRPIMLFDRQGKFVRYIGSIGQGPEDMLLHASIGYDEDKQEIIVPDMVDLKVYGINGKFKRKLFKYREDGEYWYANRDAREIRDYRFADGYHIFRRMFPVPTVNESWQIMIFDYNGRLVAKIADPINVQHEDKIAVDLMTAMPSSYWHCIAPIMSFYHGTHSILFDANDTIYLLPASKERLIPRYLMKTGSEVFTPEVLHSIDQTGDFLNKYIQPRDILETQDYIYLVAEKGVYSHLCRFNKMTGEVQSVHNKGEVIHQKAMGIHVRRADAPGFTDDLAGGCSFFPRHTNDNEWIGVIPAERLLHEIDIEELERKEVKLPHRKKQLIDVLRNLNEDDNPVLMIVKLK